jgi:two-component system, chemotaxis family, chemotaxis protein CheY
MTVKKANILVVEDNKALSGVVTFNLVRAGFQVTAVGNGKEALEALQHNAFDLMLTDQQMPNMTGIQLCEHARQIPGYQNLPIILLTAKCMEMNFSELRERIGLSAALPKPFSPSELINCIEECLVAGCRS